MAKRASKKRIRYQLTAHTGAEKTTEEDGRDEGLLLADGLDEAFLGVGRRCGQPEIAVYSVARAVLGI